MNLRPQGPEIIRTWLFYTIVRAEAEHGLLPWSDTMINGWVTNPAATVLTAFGVIALIGVVTIGMTLYLFKKVIS